VEPLSKVCHTCKKLNKKPQTSETASLKADNEPKCKANYEGSAPAMELDFKCIFLKMPKISKFRYCMQDISRSIEAILMKFSNSVIDVSVLCRKAKNNFENDVGCLLNVKTNTFALVVNIFINANTNKKG
jgi:hypothetical protein